MRQRTVEHNDGHVLSFLDEVVHLDVELVRGRVLRALDVPADIVVVADVDNAVVFARDLVTLDNGGELL